MRQRLIHALGSFQLAAIESAERDAQKDNEIARLKAELAKLTPKPEGTPSGETRPS